MRFLAIARNWLVHLVLWALVWLAFTLGPLYGLGAWGAAVALWALAWGLSQVRVRRRRPDPELGRQLSALYEGIQGAFILEARRAGRRAQVRHGQFFFDAGAASALAPRERLAYAVQRIELALRGGRRLNHLLSYLFIGALVALGALGALAAVRELPEPKALLPPLAILSLAVPALFPDLFARRHLFLADRATAQAVDPRALASALFKLRASEEIPGWYELLPARPRVAERLRRLAALGEGVEPVTSVPAPQRMPGLALRSDTGLVRAAEGSREPPPAPPAPAAFLVEPPAPPEPTNGASPLGWHAPPTKPLPEEELDVLEAVREKPRRLRQWWRR